MSEKIIEGPIAWNDDELKIIMAIRGQVPDGVIVEWSEVGSEGSDVAAAKVHLRIFGVRTYVILLKALTPYGVFYEWQSEFGQFGSVMDLEDCLPLGCWLAHLGAAAAPKQFT